MCPSLQHVELPKNGIGDIGAQAAGPRFVVVAAASPSTLFLSEALADVVKTTTSLMSLDLRENCLLPV